MVTVTRHERIVTEQAIVVTFSAKEASLLCGVLEGREAFLPVEVEDLYDQLRGALGQ